MHEPRSAQEMWTARLQSSDWRQVWRPSESRTSTTPLSHTGFGSAALAHTRTAAPFESRAMSMWPPAGATWRWKTMSRLKSSMPW